MVYYTKLFFIPVLIKGSLYKATRKQIRWTNVKEEEKMPKCIVNIYADCRVEVKLDGRSVEEIEEINIIASKINKKEIDAEVYFEDEKTQLYEMQGGIGANGHGFIAPILFNPLANLFLALSNQEELRLDED